MNIFTFWTTVPPALRNIVPVPSAAWRMNPIPPQQHEQQLQSQSAVTLTSPVEPIYEPLLTIIRPYLERLAGITFEG